MSRLNRFLPNRYTLTTSRWAANTNQPTGDAWAGSKRHGASTESKKKSTTAF